MNARQKLAAYAYSLPQSRVESEMATPSTMDKETAATKGDIADLLAEIRNMGASIGGKIDKLTQRLDSIEDRVEGVENNQASIDVLETQMGHRITELEQREQEFRLKMDDLENRERRNNLRFFGIPEKEGETEEDLKSTLHDIIKLLVADDNIDEPKTERIHRAGGPPGGPRSVLARFHRYQDRMRVLEKARSGGTITLSGAQITIFQDLSSLTLSLRKMCRPLTTWLKGRDVRYRWGYPFSLSFEHEGTRIRLNSEQDIKACIADLLGQHERDGSHDQPPMSQGEWHVQGPKRKKVKGSRKYRRGNGSPEGGS